jgi:hypothetical protein
VLMTLGAAFQPVLVPQGHVVRTTAYIGCTGAVFRLTGDNCIVVAMTREEKQEAEKEIQASEGLRLVLAPKIKADIKSPRAIAVLGAEIGNLSKTSQRESKTKFRAPVDSRLVTLPMGDNGVEWAYDRDRGAATVRDYLHEQLELQTELRLLQAGRVLATAWVKDRLFFGPDKRPLSSFASIRLWAKLKFRGALLPSLGMIRHRIYFPGAST